ncbi:phage minor head protein [Sedimentitalea sp. JM2-8]|uniref:Phage minor head protein n=1 Tax=Sedimentitalea xiamensis TaxID=3050037 RepID=A0ABT7FCB2_9RHOB|nr:phage minor head protein [Sedimentitalea xiamensis]MDK3072759.1 phage minor head protein [Sedimentitalea xiamensis]
MTEPLGATFRRPFAEQVAAFRLRLGDLVPTVRWDDISRAQHDRAFMVAGATKADLLADLAASVDKAIVEGTGFQAFKKDFRAIVAKHGWHGWTGEGTEAGENWRMRTIYRTNMRVSYMAGRHAQLREGGFRYWVYRHGGSLEPRLHHLAWDGLILESDHPFWTRHYPPNGWGCSCRVFGARSMAGAKRRGGIPGKTLPDGWDSIEPKTGTPKGIGKGWDYAPGGSVADVVGALARKASSLSVRTGDDMIRSWLQVQAFRDWLDRRGIEPTVEAVRAFLAREFGRAT